MDRHSDPARARHIASENRLPLRDPERMGALMRSLEPRLSAVALGVTKDPDGAQDVVQNAFEKVLRHGDKFRGQARVSTWMHRIVTNEALMWRRTRGRRRETPLENPDDLMSADLPATRTPSDLAESRQLIARVRAALEELPREEREVLSGCALGGRSYAEFGRATGLHPAAVKSRAHRARRRLAGILHE